MAGIRIEDRFFDDYQVGERFQSMGRTIDQGDITAFAGLTLDYHPAHVDAAFAGKAYGGRIAHGMLTFAVVTGLTVEYNLAAISYGYDRVRFPNPVRAGQTLVATSEVVALRDARNPNYGLVVKHYEGTTEDGSVVFVCEHTLAVRRGPAVAA